MIRTRSITAAAILLIFLSVLNILSTVQNDLDWISYFSITYSTLGLIAAVGLWRGFRWGFFLAPLVVLLSVVDLSRGVFDSQLESFARIVAIVFSLLYVLVAVLVLRNRDKVAA